MCDDEVFADRFPHQSAMLENPVLVRLSRLLHARIAYEVAITKTPQNSAEYPIVLHDLIRLNSTVSRVQTPKCTMMKFSLIDTVIN